MIRFALRLLLVLLVTFAFLPFPGRAAPPGPPPAPPVKTCPCSSLCTCGCRQGGPCECGGLKPAPAPQVLYYRPVPYYYPAPPAFYPPPAPFVRFGGGRPGGC